MCSLRCVDSPCVCSDTHWFIGWQGSGCKESALQWLHCKTSPQPYIQPLCQRSTITIRVTRKNDVKVALIKRVWRDGCFGWFPVKTLCSGFPVQSSPPGQKAEGDFFNTGRKIWRSRLPNLTTRSILFSTITNWHMFVFYKSQVLQDVTF